MLRKLLPTLITFVLGIAIGAMLVRLAQPGADVVGLLGAILGATIAVGGAIFAADYGRTRHQKGYALALLPEVERAATAISAFRALGEDNSGTGPDAGKGLIANIRNEVDALSDMPLEGTLLPESVTAIRRGLAASSRLLGNVEGNPGTVWIEQALGTDAEEASKAFQRAIEALKMGH